MWLTCHTYITVITITISLTYSYSCNCIVACSCTENYIAPIISVKLHVKVISGKCSDTCEYMYPSYSTMPCISPTVY